MSSDENFVKFIVDQIAPVGIIRYRKMFGEYTIYCDEKIVALICDNKLFVKQTDGGKNFIGDTVQAPPYPGAKPCFLIEDKFEDQEWISSLIKITQSELPPPKPKKGKIK